MTWIFLGILTALGVFLMIVGKKDVEDVLEGIPKHAPKPFGELPAGVLLICAVAAISMVKIFVPTHTVQATPSCRDQLGKKICVVSAPKVEKDRYRSDRVCETADTSVFLRQLNTAFDAYPEFIQNQLCSLSKIYLEKEFFGNAWSDTGIIAINKALSDANPEAGAALSGFDQLTFGGDKPGFSSTLSSPMVRVTPAMSAVTHTLLHELAHTFDYQYDFQAKAWKQDFWKGGFPLQKKICLNNCDHHFIATTEISELYKELSEYGFVSQLAAVSSMEDFAETFAFLVEHESMGSKRVILIDGAETDLLVGKAVSKKIAVMNWIMTWLAHGAKGEVFKR